MTPLQKAQQIIDDLAVMAAATMPEPLVLPSLQYAQMGAQVVACPSLIAAVISMQPDGAQTGAISVICDAVQIATFAITLAYDCSWVSNEDGTDDPTRVATVSAQMAGAGQILWDYAEQLSPHFSKQWDVTWVRMSGLSISTLNLTTGVD